MDAADRAKWANEIAQDVIDKTSPSLESTFEIAEGTPEQYKAFVTTGYEAWMRFTASLLTLGVPAEALLRGVEMTDRVHDEIKDAIEEHADKLVGAGQT